MRNTAHKKAGTVTAILMIFGLLAVTAILPVNATESYIRGDANGDGVVSIGDVKPFNGTLPSSNILTATV